MISSEYYAWVNMRQRCLNSNHPEYYRYGGRGITVCDRWLDSFSNFIEDMGIKPSKDLSLDRIDNEKGYSPENCRWETKAVQSYNQRVSIDSKTGVVGVYFEKQTSHWKSYIRKDGKQITIGRFKDFFDAVCARKSAELEYYGDVSHV